MFNEYAFCTYCNSFTLVLINTIGKLILQLVIEPVRDLKTIGYVSHTLVERSYVIASPSIGAKDIMNNAAKGL